MFRVLFNMTDRPLEMTEGIQFVNYHFVLACIAASQLFPLVLL